jgi:chemotaxis response regulator CheB
VISIGLICDHHSAVLAGRIERAGYKTVRLEIGRLNKGGLPDVSTWVLDCVDIDTAADAIAEQDIQLLTLSNRPLHSDASNYHHWCDRIIQTLDKWHSEQWQEDKQSQLTCADEYSAVAGVWLLVGSAGATEAIVQFFNRLDPLPPLAFIYAQHINPEQQGMLKTVVRSNPELVGSLIVGRHWLNPGHVYIVPAGCQIKMTSHGEIFSSRQPWVGPETPDFNQLMAMLSGLQQPLAGVIMFSGAGEDGVVGLQALAARGSRIWVQQPDTAAVPSMPLRALESAVVQKQGSPQQLAREIIELYRPN